jgi:3-methyladenine DNA glycosylase AlkD
MFSCEVEIWVVDVDFYDVCDQVCMNLLAKSPLVLQKIAEWLRREETFVKQAAFALIACFVWHDKAASG